MSSFGELLGLPSKKGTTDEGSRVPNTQGVSLAVGGVVSQVQAHATAGAYSAGNKTRPTAGDHGAQAPEHLAAGCDEKTTTTAVAAMIDLGSLRTYTNERRAYIGASGIGDQCDAYQVLCLRGFDSEVPSARLVRIFRDGKRIEDQVIEDMESAGLSVSAVDPATGKQYRYTAFNECMSASLDGYVTSPSGQRMTLEIKSMNKALFTKFVSKGLSVSHPHYVEQMNVGLGLARDSGVDVSNGMMVAYCKDNSEYHAEVIAFSQSDYDNSKRRVQALLSGVRTGVRISSYKAAYQCSSCFKRSACWEPDVREPDSCKLCKYAETSQEGDWSCSAGMQYGSVCRMFTVFRVTPNGK